MNMEQVMPNATIEDKVIPLPFGCRIKVTEIKEQHNGGYLGKGIEQFPGVFMYRNIQDVVLSYGIDKKLNGILQLDK